MASVVNRDPATGQSASLRIGDRQVELPIVEGTEHERAVDISRLRADTGLLTLDEGYVNTAATLSTITFLDGEKSILRYRGYPIDVLATERHA